MHSKLIVCIIDTECNVNYKIPSVVNIPIKFSYNDFVTIDQRLKSYVQHTFFRENEEFVLVFRVCFIVFYFLNYY